MVKLRHLKTNELRPRKWLKVSTVGDKMQKLWGNGFQTMFYDLIRTSSLEGFSMPLHHYILLPLFLRKDFHYSENHKGLLVYVCDRITTLLNFPKDAVMMILRPTVFYELLDYISLYFTHFTQQYVWSEGRRKKPIQTWVSVWQKLLSMPSASYTLLRNFLFNIITFWQAGYIRSQHKSTFNLRFHI